MQPMLCMCAGNQGLEIVLFKQIVWKGTYGMVTFLQGSAVPQLHNGISQSEYSIVHYANTLIPFYPMEHVRAEYASEYLAGTHAMHGCTIRREFINGILLK